MTTFSTSRVFPASPESVFAAIQDPARLATWWGPNGFSNRFEVFEFQPGGKWVFDMIGPDGQVYPNEAVFTHIEAGRQVIVEHTCLPHFTLTLTLTPSAEGTTVHWVQTFADAAVASAVRHIVEPANEQNLDRWGAALGQAKAPTAGLA
jgi:uncharacterized protein YndB with AHSA1/START domain